MNRNGNRRLLTIGHSYCVSLNRKIAEEIELVSKGKWSVTVVSPKHVKGDLRSLDLEVGQSSPTTVVGVKTRFQGSMHFLQYCSDTREIIQQGNLDLIHIWEEPYIVCGEQLSRWSKNVPHVFFTFQNLCKKYPPPFRWFEQRSMERCSGWIAAGKTVQEALVKKACYSGREHRTIPLGVDMEHFKRSLSQRESMLRKLEWEDDGVPILGYLGRFVKEKGLDLIMSTLPQLAGRWRMLFVGGGPYEVQLNRFQSEYGDRVRVVTGIRHDEVPSALNSMDVLLAPSQTTPAWREQLGRMLLEAFACQIPVVASDSGEIPNVVGDAGVILPESNETLWVKAVQDLIDSPTQRKLLAQKAYVRCREVFDWKVIAQRHIEFFEELLD